VWGELDLTSVVYAGEDGTVANLHFMPVAFIPTSKIGYSPTGVTSSDLGSANTGATVAFPNLYADIKGISWLFGGTPWVGTRYYKRESVYISDFFYWNPSGVGAGIEDVNVGQIIDEIGYSSDFLKALRLSYAVFAVDGEPKSSPKLPRQRCRRKLTSAFETMCSFEGSGRTRAVSSRSGSSTLRIIATTKMIPERPSHMVDGASLSDTCRTCSVATTSWFSNMVRVGERALERSRAFITPTSRFTTSE
jgi:hypothetical protein